MYLKNGRMIMATGVIVAAGALDMLSGNKMLKASINLFDNPALKWGAIITAVLSASAGVVYLLANKDALKRKVTEFGEISFVVMNGNTRRYRLGKRKGKLVVRRAGQGKNVIPRLRDQVTVSWLHDVLVVRNLEMMYKNRRLGFDLSIEYSLPEPDSDENLERLAAMVFGFRDRNRYNEQVGTLEQHIELRCSEQVPSFLATREADDDGIPTFAQVDVDWLDVIKFDEKVTLSFLRIGLINKRFTSQIELK